ncbi:hypothetical protein FRC04_003049 [Tulasnella sp. 424]|nr:hypothetical protein FRC04_003049 [Tulasnella sp. 424]KAG8981156.1 hypothetical protein FRC05_004057 [Tulasnella sp. 425]
MAPCAASPSGTWEVHPSAAHPLSTPSYPGPSNDDHPYVNGNFHDDHWQVPHTPDIAMDPEDNQDPYGNLGTPASSPQLNDMRQNLHGTSKQAPKCGQFLGKLNAMLADDAMKDYIAWRRVEDLDGLFIPNIEAFVENALPEHFPEMNQWGSFQRQLSNYGFRKKGRDKTKGFYIHSDKKICRGRPYPPPEAMRWAKAAKPQHPAQEHPLAADSPAVPQPPCQPDTYARIDHLEEQLETTKSELKATQNLVSKMAKRLEMLETQLRNLPYQLGAMFIGDGSPDQQVDNGPVGGAVDNDYSLPGAGDPNGIDHGVVPKASIGIHDDGSSQGLPPYPVMELMTYETNDLPHQQPPTPQPSTDTSFAGPPSTFPQSSGQTAVEVPAPQGSEMPTCPTNFESPTFWNWAFVLLQEAGLAAAGQSSSPNASASASTNHAPGPSQSSDSTRALGGRRQHGGMPVHSVPRLPKAGQRSF